MLRCHLCTHIHYILDLCTYILHMRYICIKPHALHMYVHIMNECTHLTDVYNYPMDPASTTYCENHIFGISGLPALSVFLLPGPALRRDTGSPNLHGCQISVTSDPSKTETPAASCNQPSPACHRGVWCAEINKAWYSAILQSRQLPWPPLAEGSGVVEGWGVNT